MNTSTGHDDETRQLKYFLMLAEERSLVRAAVRLSISPPPLRQQILQLEGRLGVCLFRRVAGAIALTPAGKAFVPEATTRLSTIAPAVKPSRSEATGINLRIGIVGSAMWSPFATHLQRFHQSHPDYSWTIRECDSESQLKELHEGSLHVGISREPRYSAKLLSEAGLIKKLYFSENAALALPEENPLSLNDDILMSDLVHEAPLTLLGDEPAFHDHLHRHCRKAGIAPATLKKATNLQSLLSMISHGAGIALVPESVARIRWPGIVFQNIEQGPTANLYVTYHKKKANQALRTFLGTSLMP